MKFPKAFRYVAGLVALGLAVSCGTERNPVAPTPNPDLTGNTLGAVTGTVGSLLSCTPLPAASASKVIGPDGGFIQVGPHLFVVPPGALASPVLITANAPSSNTNSVQFSPAGLQFAHSTALVMSYRNCGLLVGLVPKVAYTTDLLAILYYVPSINSFETKTVTGQIDHFSRYAVSY